MALLKTVSPENAEGDVGELTTGKAKVVVVCETKRPQKTSMLSNGQVSHASSPIPR